MSTKILATLISPRAYTANLLPATFQVIDHTVIETWDVFHIFPGGGLRFLGLCARGETPNALISEGERLMGFHCALA